MNLSDMAFKLISLPEYTGLRNFWYDSPKKNAQDLDFAQVTVPLRANDYQEWAQFLLEHPKGDAISVYDGVGWRQYYRKRFTPKDIEEINEFTIKDRRRVGNVEVAFRWRNKHMDHKSRYTRSIKIRLAQVSDEVVGYDVQFSVQKADLFKWESPATFTKIKVCGLWLPPQVA